MTVAPRQSGLSFARMVRYREPAPIIFVGGYPELAAVARQLEGKVFTKPVLMARGRMPWGALFCAACGPSDRAPALAGAGNRPLRPDLAGGRFNPLNDACR